MEDILASIKKVIAEEKEIRQSAAPAVQEDPSDEGQEEILELDQPLRSEEETVEDSGPPLLDETAADQSRSALEQLSTIAASAPAQPQSNPFEEMVRDMLRPILKQWLDDNLPRIVDEHVKREIRRITGKPL